MSAWILHRINSLCFLTFKANHFYLTVKLSIWFNLCAFNQLAFIHTTVTFSPKRLSVAINPAFMHIIYAFRPKELFRSSTVTSLRTTPCMCHTSPTRTLRSTLNEAQTTAVVLDTVREETARCRLVRESPPNISTLTSLSGCWCPRNTWVPLLARRAPPSVTSPSRLRASEWLTQSVIFMGNV